jgi:isopentenyl-diphosphate Delta-isomerase
MNSILHDLRGEQKNQLLVTCDTNGKPTGRQSREKCHAGDGMTHLAFLAFVKDASGDIVLTQRSVKKSLWGKHWDASVVSHVLSGETPEEAANRRGKEELGIDVTFTNIGAFYYFAKHGDSAENEYCFVLVGHYQGPIHPNPVEIDAVRAVSETDLRKQAKIDPEMFTPWLNLSLEKYTKELP